MKSIEQFLEPRDIYEKIGGNASELSQEEHGFICGLIKKIPTSKNFGAWRVRRRNKRTYS